MTTPTTTTTRSLDLPLGSGQGCVRISMTFDQAGEPESLILASGFGGGSERFNRPSWHGAPLSLPAAVIPELVAALRLLADEET